MKGGAGFPDAEQGMQGEDFPFFKVKHLAEADADGSLRNSEHTVSRETARLDGLVAAKERVLGLVAEKRRALITRVVTRGVDGSLWSAPAERSDDGAFAENDPADPAGAPRPAKAASQPPHSKKFRDSGPLKELEARGNKSTTTDSYWMVRPGDLVVTSRLVEIEPEA